MTKIKNILFIIIFCLTSSLFAASELTIKQSEKQIPEAFKTKYLIESLIPQDSKLQENCRPLYDALEILGIFTSRCVIPSLAAGLFYKKFMLKPNHGETFYDGAKAGMKMALPGIALNICDVILGDKIQNNLISDKNFQNDCATALFYSPGAYIWSLIHKYYYNQELFLNKTLTQFKINPEKFPTIAHPLLQEALTEQDSQKKVAIYYKLIELAQPTMAKLRLMEKLLWHQKQAHLGSLHELEQKAKEQYDQIQASMT